MEYKPPIIVTGAARSHTSFVAGAIDRCGAWSGNTCGATKYNKEGQYENREIINQVVKPYLKSVSADPMGQYPLPSMDDLVVDQTFGTKILDIMKRQGLTSETIWYFKGAKLTLIWPIVAGAFPDAKWVLVRRNREDIAQSCMRTGFMRKRKSYESWLEWVDIHINHFEHIKANPNIQAMEVWPSEAIVEGDLTGIREMIEWVGLDWNKDAVKNLINPNSCHFYCGERYNGKSE